MHRRDLENDVQECAVAKNPDNGYNWEYVNNDDLNSFWIKKLLGFFVAVNDVKHIAGGIVAHVQYLG